MKKRSYSKTAKKATPAILAENEESDERKAKKKRKWRYRKQISFSES